MMKDVLKICILHYSTFKTRNNESNITLWLGITMIITIQREQQW